eukprot:TRINITY_DN124_c0_g1_i1.p1 TRINITY_DN124_c0_g1~~TRINITY_DN124_c0_g1_i1.p1  ORF type:complete len:111 (+),score=12.02 TRINITY_DN124_c0_g1_i1:218-550(+)
MDFFSAFFFDIIKESKNISNKYNLIKAKNTIFKFHPFGRVAQRIFTKKVLGWDDSGSLSWNVTGVNRDGFPWAPQTTHSVIRVFFSFFLSFYIICIYLFRASGLCGKMEA